MDNWITRQVLNYVNSYNTDALAFKGIPKEKEPSKDEHLTELVYQCVLLSRDYFSYLEYSDRVTCDSDRFRSSLDIWRHVKHYKPDATIFDVMNTLWYDRERYYGHYCGDVQRRVFKARVKNKDGRFSPSYGVEYIHSESYDDEYYDDDYTTDEYELYFDEWANVRG